MTERMGMRGRGMRSSMGLEAWMEAIELIDDDEGFEDISTHDSAWISDCVDQFGMVAAYLRRESSFEPRQRGGRRRVEPCIEGCGRVGVRRLSSFAMVPSSEVVLRRSQIQRMRADRKDIHLMMKRLQAREKGGART